MKAGVYTMSAAEYHADPVCQPSLSASLATILCTQSAKHAWASHPRLNPNFVRETEDKFDLGTAAHDVLLGGAEGVIVLPAGVKDWRTNEAKAARDIARQAGKVAILAHQMQAVTEMVNAARVQLRDHEDGCTMFRGGEAEQTLIWQEPDFGGIWCRARLDYLRGNQIDDLKSSAASAEPDSWSRTMFGMGADIQVSWYLRGLKKVTGLDGAFRFAVVENYAPYALSVVTLAPDAMTLAEKKCLWALDQWQRCLDAGKWPGYPTRTAFANLPAYLENAWLQKEVRDVV